MTVSEVKAMVAEIEKAKKDPEYAHKLEDMLYLSVLEFLASLRNRILDGELAYEALKARKIDFPRWTA